ncbi:EAL domain-containing protein [Pseudanabaena sp. FACHB-1998]|uniref:EAL domain-containing protein n=1 Tax=Pseudanabaena sp. FACHB-1998 TaxID=2692858 RepID=UPI0016800488|nr:EAL domain-containing protein [Pseudanabaena sp. FACHB-1998]MBD2176071.1 EAL domain-containing protein [Pseudanabaena sp. FACHB-1998]
MGALLLVPICIIISSFFLHIPVGFSSQLPVENLFDSSPIINLNDHHFSYDLSKHLRFLEDKNSDLTIEQVSSSEFNKQFQPSKIDPPNFGYTASTYWARLQVKNLSDRDTEWILSIEHPHLDHISLYVTDSQDKWTVKTTGVLYPFSAREIRDRLPAFPIRLAGHLSQNLYLRFQSETPIIAKAYLRSPTNFWQYRTDQNIWLGLIIGILAFAILYNLFLFAVLREQVYLYYGFFVLGILLAFISYDGIGKQYLWQDWIWGSKYCSPLMLVFGLTSLLEAASLFLEAQTQHPRWYYLLRVHQALLIIICFSFLVLPYQLVSLIGIIVCVSGCSCAFILGIISLLKGYKPALYYLLSFSSFLLGIVTHLLSIIAIIPPYEWIKDIYRIGMVVFVVSLALVLADRINFLKLEKFREQKLALREKEKLNQSLQRSQEQLLEREKQLEYDVLHDALTGLANRTWLTQRLQDLLQQQQKFAILFIDLDRFKVINDSLGHLVGDELLRQASKRMQLILPDFGTLTRFGGDEFVILVQEYIDLDRLTELADLLQIQLQLPFNLHNYELFISASLGITLATEEYTQPDEILRDADLAMYQAKQKGRGRYELFTQSDHTAAMTRLNLERDLRYALDKHEFYLMYQPIVALQTQQICGFEALVRWKNRAGQQISPEKFIPITEETGLINSLGWWIMEAACQQTQIWNQQLNNPNNTNLSINNLSINNLSININVSPIQLRQFDFVKTLKQILMETGLPNHCLKLEITESCLLENIDSDTNLLKDLKDLGIQLCIDDFGTGYSSLSRLHDLPIDTLKIDQSFVKRIGSKSDSTVIIETIISLSQSLNIHTVAEGIETRSQLDKLIAIGCNFGQGYLFSRPCDLEAAYKLLQNGLTFAPDCKL